MKKRVVALTLATVMSLGAVASVAATDLSSAGSSTEGEVKAEVKELVLPKEKTYLVTVTIPEMAFEYTMGTAGEWDPETLKYGTPEDAKWTKEPTAEITVKNKSDADVKLTCEYKDAGKVGGLESSITGGDEGGATKTLASAVNPDDPLKEGTATDVTFTLKLTGTPDKVIPLGTTIGTVTLTVSEAE